MQEKNDGGNNSKTVLHEQLLYDASNLKTYKGRLADGFGKMSALTVVVVIP